MINRLLAGAGSLLLLPLASASLISPPAVGEVVQIRMSGFAKGYATVDVTLDPDGVIGAGQLSGWLNNQSFLTYCVDLGQSFSWNTNYNYTLLANNPQLGNAPLQGSGFSQQQANLLGKLYTSYGSADTATSVDRSVAFQLATWEIVYETGSVDNITDGAFKLISGASTDQRNLTNEWLIAINRSDAPLSFNAQRLYSSVAQDFVLFTGLPPPRPQIRINVPEPSSYALVGLALAGLSLTQRRRPR